jgi:DNA-binding NarL/FixJ family response regulator
MADMGQTDSRVSLLVVEDDDLLRDLLVDTLSDESDFEVVGAVGDGDQAVEAVHRLNPRVVLLDLHLPGTPGLSVLERLSQIEDGPSVLVFSGDSDEDTQVDAARNGARGYLTKTDGAAKLPEALRTVAARHLWFAPRVADRILRDYADVSRRIKEQDKPVNRLTDREREVLLGIARGLTNKQIAGELFMSVHTVKLHVQNILKKLALPNRTEAAVFAVREGLLDSPPGDELAVR